MNSRNLFLPLVFCLAHASSWANQPTKGPLPEIRVTNADWGRGSLRDISKVLNSSARQLWPHAEQRKMDFIQVSRSANGPIVLFRRGNEGQYFVNLNTQDMYWCQYAFQFSHEFGHILCGYKPGARENLWFEETLCETASLFAMRKMSKTWAESPPYPSWRSYAPNLDEYAQERIDTHPWPYSPRCGAPLTLAEWYAKNREALRKNPTDRPKNTTLATKLLPLFEQQPDNWSAVAYLNFHKTKKSRQFHTYLADWKRTCPQVSQKNFVGKLEELFGVGETLKDSSHKSSNE